MFFLIRQGFKVCYFVGDKVDMLYNFYLFNRKGVCLFYKEWSRPNYCLSDEPEEDRKLMYGMLFSLQDMAAKMSPENSSEGIHTIKSKKFTIHRYQCLSGITLVLNTDPSVPDCHANLFHIFSNIYVVCVNRNPLYSGISPDDPITCPIFEQRICEYLKSESLL